MKYILAMLLLFSIGASAQTQVDSITVKQKLKLNGYRLTGVSNDTTTANQDSGKVITEGAVKKLILGRSASRDVQIAAKINYTDSAGMLAAYQAALLARLKYTDTASMLAAYRTALLARLKYTDTASMLAAYQTALLARLKYTDSTGMLAAYQTAINSSLKYTDSSGMLAAYQSALNARQVTLVSATNIKTINGSSILGSGNLTINPGLTGSGTVSSALVPLPFWSTSNSDLSSTGNSYLNWDTTNHALNIGTSTQQSSYKLNVNGNVQFGNLTWNNSSTTLSSASSSALTIGSYYSIYGQINLDAYNGVVITQGGLKVNAQSLTAAGPNGNTGGLNWNGTTLSLSNSSTIYNIILTAGLQNGSIGSCPFYITGQQSGNTPGTGGNVLIGGGYGNSGGTFGNVILGVSNRGTGGNILVSTTTDDGVNKMQVNGTLKATAFNSNATQTTLSGGTSGTAIFSQPMQGVSLKKVIVYCNALNGATSTYTFPIAFTNTPAIVTTSGLASSLVTTLTSSTMVVTGSTSTGVIILEGY